MADSIGNIYNNYFAQSNTGSLKAAALENKLNHGAEEADDEEMLETCKEFEAYLLEQVLKQVKESMPKAEEEENEYMEYFGDMMIQEYAGILSEHTDLGIAQTLYEAMKNNMTTVNIKEAEENTALDRETGTKTTPVQNINM